jgi:hypothetical protein
MKKVALFFVLVSISVMSFSQLILGGHFAYNSTWLMNKQVFDAGAEMDIAASFGSYYGLVAGYYVEDKFGIEININSNKIEKKYQGSIDYLFSDTLRNTYNASTVLKTTDIPILLKFGENSYFEIGSVIQLVNKATYTRTFEEVNVLNPGWYNSMGYTFSNLSNEGVKSTFNGVGFGVAFGFGANFNIIEDVLKFNFGMRFNYILSDLEGINGLGLTKDSDYVTESGKVNFYNHPLYGGLKVGLIYYFD